MLVVDLGIQPDIVETGGEESKLERTEDWNTDRGKEKREIINRQTI